MPTKQFDDRTHWDKWEGNGSEGWSHPGWALPSDPSRYISDDDPYWGQVLDKARHTYGDPSIHYDNGEPGADRHLMFGDGTKLPADGKVVYHNSDTKQDWAQNNDGTTSLIGPDGKPGSALPPGGYRKVDDQYAPINDHGQQVGPLVGGVPNSDNGFYNDPKNGVLTPKNANGDYYTLGPDGRKSFFDKTGAPITEDQYKDANTPRRPGSTDPGMDTDEQQSGQGADAIKKMHDELHGQYTKISDADERFSEVLLNAHATNAAGRDKLNDIQKQIVAAVNDPKNSMDTPAGERAFLTFLREQAAEVNDLVSSGALSADDQSKVAQATAALYAADAGDGTHPDQPPGAPPPAPAPSPTPDPGVTDPGTDPGDPDLGLGPAPQMPDPNMGLDPGGMGGADPLSSLTSALPGALGGLGGLSSPLDGLSGLGSALGDLGGDRGHPSDGDDSSDSGKDDDKKSSDTTSPAAAPAATQPPGGTQPGQPDTPNGTNPPGQPPAPVAPPAGASPTVTLPDGSTGTARSAQAASAVRDYLAGTPVDAAYRQNGLQLPPPGTPITNPVDTNSLTCGDVAMFKDHYEPVLSSVKGYHNGQVVPLGSVSSSPDFMGFFNPAAAAATGSPPAPPPASPLATAPPPANEVPAPVGG
jgi:Domain of unknown function (DUF4226)